MRQIIWLAVGLVVGLAVGALLGGALAPTSKTVTQTALQTAITSALEQALENGTYLHFCVFCGMPINDTRFSALVILRDGHVVRTDDIGCVFRMALLPPEKWPALQVYPAEDVQRLVQIYKVFVPDFDTGEYVEAQSAFYVIRQDMKTPMGDCVLAFKDRSEAAKMNATVYTYDQMLQLYREVMEKTGRPMPNWCRGGMGGMGGGGMGS